MMQGCSSVSLQVFSGLGAPHDRIELGGLYRYAGAGEEFLPQTRGGVSFKLEVTLDLFREFLRAVHVCVMMCAPVMVDVMKDEWEGQSLHLKYLLVKL
jgi:hypothetical protein